MGSTVNAESKQRQDEGTIEAQRSGDSEEAEMITWNIGGSSP